MSTIVKDNLNFDVSRRHSIHEPEPATKTLLSSLASHIPISSRHRPRSSSNIPSSYRASSKKSYQRKETLPLPPDGKAPCLTILSTHLAQWFPTVPNAGKPSTDQCHDTEFDRYPSSLRAFFYGCMLIASPIAPEASPSRPLLSCLLLT